MEAPVTIYIYIYIYICIYILIIFNKKFIIYRLVYTYIYVSRLSGFDATNDGFCTKMMSFVLK